MQATDQVGDAENKLFLLIQGSSIRNLVLAFCLIGPHKYTRKKIIKAIL